MDQGSTKPQTAVADEAGPEEVPAGSELREALGDVPFDEYVDVDKHVEVSGPLSDVEIIKVVRPGVVVQGSDDDSDDEELSPPSIPAPSAADAETALGVVERFFSGEENAEDALRCIRNLQSRVTVARMRQRKQSKIDQFFS